MGGLKPQDWEQLITEQWKLHYPESQYLLSMQDVKFIISVVRGFVVQGRDHAPDDLHVFCPNFYWQGLKKTFGDTEVYSSSLLSPAEAQSFLQEKASQTWLKPYRWGINKNATIPILYVLLKKKKQFAVARPIIFYSNFIFGRLFRAASTVLNMLFPAVYPGSFGLQTLPEFFQELHAFLCGARIDIHLQQHNQDLVLFFTSLPIEQVMDSVHHLLHSTLPSSVQIGQMFHSLYSWQQQSPSFECFKDNLKDTTSKQESSGSKIGVNSVSCLFTHRYFLT